MRYGILTAMAILLMAGQASAALIIHDPFLSGADAGAGEYVDGADLGGANPTVPGASGAWSPTPSGNSLGDILTTSSGLSYSAGSISVGSGGGVIQGNTNFDQAGATRGTTSSASNAGPGEMWFAALFKADSDNANNDNNYVTLNFDGGANDSLTIGINNLSFHAEGAAISGTDYTAGTTALAIGRMTVTSVGGSTNEAFDVWFNPTDLSDLSTAQATFSGAGNYVFGNWGEVEIGVSYTSSSGQGRQVDEIMVGDTLADLEAVLSDTGGGGGAIPEPATAGLALLAMGGLIARRRRA